MHFIHNSTNHASKRITVLLNKLKSIRIKGTYVFAQFVTCNNKTSHCRNSWSNVATEVILGLS